VTTGGRFDHLEHYQPPTGDEPLGAVELAFVRALVPVIAERIREELMNEQRPRVNDGATHERKAG
jgi:hypothetical protein